MGMRLFKERCLVDLVKQRYKEHYERLCDYRIGKEFQIKD